MVLGALAPSSPYRMERLYPVPSASSANNACFDFKADERDFTAKMNAERKKKGKSNMALDPELSKVARKHTNEMVNKNLLHHTDSSTLARRVTSWTTLGENVGVGSTVDSLHTAFMNSPAHRDNVLFSSFKYVGVGTKTVDGRLWVTVIFEAQTNPGTTLNMPRC